MPVANLPMFGVWSTGGRASRRICRALKGHGHEFLVPEVHQQVRFHAVSARASKKSLEEFLHSKNVDRNEVGRVVQELEKENLVERRAKVRDPQKELAGKLLRGEVMLPDLKKTKTIEIVSSYLREVGRTEQAEFISRWMENSYLLKWHELEVQLIAGGVTLIELEGLKRHLQKDIALLVNSFFDVEPTPTVRIQPVPVPTSAPVSSQTYQNPRTKMLPLLSRPKTMVALLAFALLLSIVVHDRITISMSSALPERTPPSSTFTVVAFLSMVILGLGLWVVGKTIYYLLLIYQRQMNPKVWTNRWHRLAFWSVVLLVLLATTALLVNRNPAAFNRDYYSARFVWSGQLPPDIKPQRFQFAAETIQTRPIIKTLPAPVGTNGHAISSIVESRTREERVVAKLEEQTQTLEPKPKEIERREPVAKEQKANPLIPPDIAELWQKVKQNRKQHVRR